MNLTNHLLLAMPDLNGRQLFCPQRDVYVCQHNDEGRHGFGDQQAYCALTLPEMLSEVGIINRGSVDVSVDIQVLDRSGPVITRSIGFVLHSNDWTE